MLECAEASSHRQNACVGPVSAGKMQENIVLLKIMLLSETGWHGIANARGHRIYAHMIPEQVQRAGCH